MPVPNITALRVLINDQDAKEFTADTDIQVFLDTAAQIESAAAGTLLPGDGNLLLAASLALQSLVTKYGSIPIQEVSIGGFQSSVGRTQVRFLEQQAQRFYDMYIDTPAFAIIEENNCGYNELTIIRNWVLRNEI
jgi:hypothetical protein